MWHVSTMLGHYKHDPIYGHAYRTTKNILVVLALGIAALGEGAGMDTGQLIIIGMSALGWIIAVAGVAAVMRYKVNELTVKVNEMDKWKESHDSLHDQIGQVVSKLTTLCDASQDRLRRIEDNEDRRDRRKGDR